jgi:putative flippase GtrA
MLSESSSSLHVYLQRFFLFFSSSLCEMLHALTMTLFHREIDSTVTLLFENLQVTTTQRQKLQ